jgi:integrase
VSRDGWLSEQLRRYTTEMTTSPLYLLPRNPPAPLPAALPNGLTSDDADRIAEAIAAARTESTRKIYAYTWGQWARWCAGRGLASLPGDPAALCAYLTERAEAGIAVVSLDGACTAIRHVHRMHDLPDPVASETVRQVRLGLRRTYGTAPRQLARPLSTDDIRQILDHLDRTTPPGIRDAAIILLGYASAMRRSEIIGLDLPDVREEPDGVLVTIRKSKTDQEGHGQIVAIARGKNPTTDPVAAMAAWRKLRGHQPGPLFTRFYRSQISLEALAGESVSRILRRRAKEAGLDAERITAHSLRAGHATTAALGGVPLARIAAQTRHKDLSVLVNRYIRPLEALATTSSRNLGL